MAMRLYSKAELEEILINAHCVRQHKWISDREIWKTAKGITFTIPKMDELSCRYSQPVIFEIMKMILSN